MDPTATDNSNSSNREDTMKHHQAGIQSQEQRLSLADVLDKSVQDQLAQVRKDFENLGGDDNFSEASYEDEINKSSNMCSESGTMSDDRDGPVVPQLAAKESKQVLASKALVAIVLIVSTSVLGYFTYSFTQAEEQQQFENQVRMYMSRLFGYKDLWWWEIEVGRVRG